MAMKMLPSNLEAEKCVLGAMLIRDGESINDIQSYLSPEEFYSEENRLIYQAMLEVYDQNKTIDLILLTEHLNRKGELDKVGGYQFILYLGNNVPTNARILDHARIVKDKFKLRRLIEIGEEIADEAYADREEIDKIIDNAERKIFSIASRATSMQFEHVQSIILRVHKKINALYDGGGRIIGLPTDYPTLDKMTGGLQRSDFIIIAARPSMGKTAMAINIADNIARIKTDPDGKLVREGRGTVAIFSLEMSKDQIGHRLLSLESGLDSQRLGTAQIKDDEWAKIHFASERIARSKIFIDDTPGLTSLEIRARARRLQAEFGLDLIIIDYLQLMQGRQRRGEFNRQQEISEISRGLKALARELDVPLIALSQLSRAVELRAEKKPQLSDLRESGSLEQDADIVMFLYRESYYNPEAPNPTQTELIIAKHRNGPTGVIKFNFTKESMMFSEIDERH